LSLGKNEHINLFSSSSDPAVSWGIVCHEAENVNFRSPDTYIFTVSFLFSDTDTNLSSLLSLDQFC